MQPSTLRTRGEGRMRDFSSYGLTKEQMDTIRQKVQEMREAGASREEIEAAMIEMLREWASKLHDKSDNFSSPLFWRALIKCSLENKPIT